MCLVTPAMRLRELLEESAAAAREGMLTKRGLPRGVRGARWSARFLKRYRSETVFVSPPPLLQDLLIALLAREPAGVTRRPAVVSELYPPQGKEPRRTTVSSSSPISHIAAAVAWSPLGSSQRS